MASRVPPTPPYADDSSGSLPAASAVWRRGDADSMSARITAESTTDAGYTTAGVSPTGPQSVSPLPLRGSPYTKGLASVLYQCAKLSLQGDGTADVLKSELRETSARFLVSLDLPYASQRQPRAGGSAPKAAEIERAVDQR
jgi:hypothetical protein